MDPINDISAGLVELLRARAWTVTEDYVPNDITWHHSKVDAEARRVFIYYPNEIIKLAVTAHEAGHAIGGFLYSGPGGIPEAEAKASRWALQYLKPRVSSFIYGYCKAIYRKALNNYKEG